MQNTRDHTEIVDLRKVIGLEEEETNGASKPETSETEPAASTAEPVAA